MYCLKCGKEQPSGHNRYCTQCGFAFAEAMRLLSAELSPTASASEPASHKISDRAKGVLQGIIMFPILFGLFAMLIVVYDNFDADRMDATYSALTLIVLMSLARILYAIFFEAGKKGQPKELHKTPSPQFLPPARTVIEGFETIRQKTGELFQRGSITEQPTQSLSENNNGITS